MTSRTKTPEPPRTLSGVEMYARAQAQRQQLLLQLRDLDQQISAKGDELKAMQDAHEQRRIEQARMQDDVRIASDLVVHCAAHLAIVEGSPDETTARADLDAATARHNQLVEAAAHHQRSTVEASEAETAPQVEALRREIDTLRAERLQVEALAAAVGGEERAAYERAGREEVATLRAVHERLAAVVAEKQAALDEAQALLDAFYADVPEELAAWPERLAEAVDLQPWQPEPGAEAFRFLIRALEVLHRHPAALAGYPVYNNQVSVDRVLHFTDDEIRAVMFRSDGQQVLAQRLGMAHEVLKRLEAPEQAARERRVAAAAHVNE